MTDLKITKDNNNICVYERLLMMIALGFFICMEKSGVCGAGYA